jgi:hypothetical protein
MSLRMRFSFWLAPLVLFCLCPFLLYGQAGYGQVGGSDQSGMSHDQMGSKHEVSVTGCLKQGSENKGYYVTGQDGKVYELSGKSAEFSKHVNHTVTVMGHEKMMSKSQESKMEQSEKAESGGKSYTDLHVTTLKHVSDTCSQ